MYLLIDIGGTTTRLGVAQTPTNIDQIVRLPTPASFTEAMDAITASAQELIADKKVDVIIAGAPGPMDAEKTQILNAPNLSGWNNQPLKQTLSQNFQAETYLENDAALSGIGEATFGAGKDKPVVAYLTISTGIGGARIVNKVLDIQSTGFEPGHQIISLDGQECTCGAKGHWEGYASGAALRMKYGQEAKDISDAAIWDATARYIAIGVNNIITLWSPHIVVLGGSLMQRISLEKVESHLRDLKPVVPHPPVLALASLGDASGLWGALAFSSMIGGSTKE